MTRFAVHRVPHPSKAGASVGASESVMVRAARASSRQTGCRGHRACGDETAPGRAMVAPCPYPDPVHVEMERGGRHAEPWNTLRGYACWTVFSTRLTQIVAGWELRLTHLALLHRGAELRRYWRETQQCLAIAGSSILMLWQPNFASWNQIAGWLRRLEELRSAA